MFFEIEQERWGETGLFSSRCGGCDRVKPLCWTGRSRSTKPLSVAKSKQADRANYPSRLDHTAINSETPPPEAGTIQLLIAEHPRRSRDLKICPSLPLRDRANGPSLLGPYKLLTAENPRQAGERAKPQ